MVVIDEANEENGCLQVASNWRDVASSLSNFTEEEKRSGHLTLPFVQGGPKHGTVTKEYIYGVKFNSFERYERLPFVFLNMIKVINLNGSS